MMYLATIFLIEYVLWQDQQWQLEAGSGTGVKFYGCPFWKTRPPNLENAETSYMYSQCVSWSQHNYAAAILVMNTDFFHNKHIWPSTYRSDGQILWLCTYNP